jgi:hypothetical protein
MKILIHLNKIGLKKLCPCVDTLLTKIELSFF